jgi:hypothetical protein
MRLSGWDWPDIREAAPKRILPTLDGQRGGDGEAMILAGATTESTGD